MASAASQKKKKDNNTAYALFLETIQPRLESEHGRRLSMPDMIPLGSSRWEALSPALKLLFKTECKKSPSARKSLATLRAAIAADVSHGAASAQPPPRWETPKHWAYLPLNRYGFDPNVLEKKRVADRAKLVAELRAVKEDTSKEIGSMVFATTAVEYLYDFYRIVSPVEVAISKWTIFDGLSLCRSYHFEPECPRICELSARQKSNDGHNLYPPPTERIRAKLGMNYVSYLHAWTHLRKHLHTQATQSNGRVYCLSGEYEQVEGAYAFIRKTALIRNVDFLSTNQLKSFFLPTLSLNFEELMCIEDLTFAILHVCNRALPIKDIENDFKRHLSESTFKGWGCGYHDAQQNPACATSSCKRLISALSKAFVDLTPVSRKHIAPLEANAEATPPLLPRIRSSLDPEELLAEDAVNGTRADVEAAAADYAALMRNYAAGASNVREVASSMAQTLNIGGARPTPGVTRRPDASRQRPVEQRETAAALPDMPERWSLPSDARFGGQSSAAAAAVDFEDDAEIEREFAQAAASFGGGYAAFHASQAAGPALSQDLERRWEEARRTGLEAAGGGSSAPPPPSSDVAWRQRWTTGFSSFDEDNERISGSATQSSELRSTFSSHLPPPPPSRQQQTDSSLQRLPRTRQRPMFDRPAQRRSLFDLLRVVRGRDYEPTPAIPGLPVRSRRNSLSDAIPGRGRGTPQTQSRLENEERGTAAELERLVDDESPIAEALANELNITQTAAPSELAVLHQFSDTDEHELSSPTHLDPGHERSHAGMNLPAAGYTAAPLPLDQSQAAGVAGAVASQCQPPKKPGRGRARSRI